MTSLADYCLPGADPDLQEPLASRLLKVLDHFGGRVMILSGRRSRAEQERLYRAYLNGGNLAAVPGTSLHERGLAADLHRYDPALSWGEVHYTAAAFGLRFPIPSENWHAEVNYSWVAPPALPEDDMTPQQLAAALGPTAEIGLDGVIRVPLINDELTGHTMYPVAEALTFIHQELKMKRLAG